MTRTKDPVAHGASARRAIVKGLDRADAQQMPLPPDPVEGMCGPTEVGPHDAAAAAVEEGRGSEEMTSRKEKIVRRKRIKSPISVIDIKRTLAAVQKAGLPIATLDVRPDGSIRVEISTGTANTAVNVFEEWADRL